MSDPNKKYPPKNSPPPEGCPKDGVDPPPEGFPKDGVALPPEGCPKDGVDPPPEGCSKDGVGPPPEGCPKDGVDPPPEGCPKDGVGPTRESNPPVRRRIPTEKNPILTHINSIPIYRNFTPNLPSNVRLRNRARSLRKAGNYPEVIFWMQVHKGKFFKIDFDRQRVIGNYIVDFYIKGLSLVIEIDGSSHNNKKAYDDKREEFLRSLGLNIFRISVTRVRHDLGNVLEELKQFILETYG